MEKNSKNSGLRIAWDSLGAYIETCGGVIIEGPMALNPDAAEAILSNYTARIADGTFDLKRAVQSSPWRLRSSAPQFRPR